MTTFTAVLTDFQQGIFTRQALEEAIDRDIGLGNAAPSELLKQLKDHHQQTPLAEDDYELFRGWISRAETRQRTSINKQAMADRDATERLSTGFEQTDITVGSVINDRFELEAIIGSGGMSQVFRAIDRRKVEAHSRTPHVAVKVMNVRGIEAEKAFIAMQREVQKSQSLTHQNIVRVNDFDRDGDVVYITMELLEGVSLQQKIAGCHPDDIDVVEAIEIIHEMSAALECAHDNNIVHADFKPSNVFLTVDKRVKVIDFGIARGIKPAGLSTADQTLFDVRELGAMTPAYASPEMIEDLEPHPRDDIYALGCVAYELITGSHPYARLMATDARDNDLKPKKPANLTRQQWSALEKTLRFDPQERTSSVKDFVASFDQAGKRKNNGLLLGAAAAFAASIAAGVIFLLPQFISDTPEVFTDCSTCPDLVVVRAGQSNIGLPQSSLPGMFEFPEHTVNIVNDFAISTHEITVAQFGEFASATGIDMAGCRAADQTGDSAAVSWLAPGFSQSNNHPVTCVSWHDAQSYIAWLSTQTGQSYRLPSEAEWEYTARTVSEQPLQIESQSNACAQANIADASAARAFTNISALDCSDGFAFTAPVTRYGITSAPVDMRGNVFEWTQDCWNPSYAGAPSDGRAWQNGNCGSRILRGGSWFSSPDALRLTYRNRYPADYRSNTFGFRIVRTL